MGPVCNPTAMGKVVTDEDVELYLARAADPEARSAPKGSGGRPPVMEAFALCVPAKDPFGSPEARARPKGLDPERYPPGPCRILMKDGVWLERPVEAAHVEGVQGPPPPAPPKRTGMRRIDPSTGLTMRALQHRELKEKGLCVTCQKPQDSKVSALYCEACREKRQSWARARKGA